MLLMSKHVFRKCINSEDFYKTFKELISFYKLTKEEQDEVIMLRNLIAFI